MSKTDKTRPYDVKLAEATQADPYRSRRSTWQWGQHDLIGGCSCWACRYVVSREVHKRNRREGKAMARNWDREY